MKNGARSAGVFFSLAPRTGTAGTRQAPFDQGAVMASALAVGGPRFLNQFSPVPATLFRPPSATRLP
ncbi:MAG: hypothetical protein BWX84_00859 [Verrucomicrobia bacterium ADurb.Bin118]|nr:MAG: hypothetical protein BWX84_00859 [Verrucomicrobia bacterium ADurb.Bin118]